METVNSKTAPVADNPHGVKASQLYDTKYAQVVHIALAFCHEKQEMLLVPGCWLNAEH